MTDPNKTFRVKANEFVFSFGADEIHAADLVQNSPVQFNLIKDHRSVNATILEADIAAKKLKIEVDGETYEVSIKDELDQMLDQMGFSTASTKHVKEIKAPMPGLVLDVVVSEGQEVNEGDRILILEAMKMENSLMIHTKATIKKIHVKAGQAVEKGQVLVELD